MASKFTWLGDLFATKVQKATALALNETASDIVAEAKSRVRVDTGNLKSNIKVMKKASPSQRSIEVGVEGVAYALIQEYGPADGRPYGWTPYMRPAVEIHGKGLAGKIKTKLG